MPSRDLRRGRAVGVTVAGRSMAVFRADDGRLGAVEDKCAHRRMKLSVGTVEGARLVCPYHGWSFTCDGEGESPSAPRTRGCITSYECAESSGAVWVKSKDGRQALPVIDRPGWSFVGPAFKNVDAPLELVIDNFSEVEHTVVAHPDFGFDRRDATRAEVAFDCDEAAITVRNQGPAKMPPPDTRLIVGIRSGDFFHSDYTFRFDPPRSSVTHFWTEPRTGRERMVKYHVVHYFVPEDDDRTRIATFAFLNIRWPIVGRIGRHLGWLFLRKLRQTIDEDIFLLENLADKSSELEGMKLSRFDPILKMTRDRLCQVYYGAAGSEADR